MSRIGKQPIDVPDGVTVSISDREVTVKSSKGELKVPFPESITVVIEGSLIKLTPVSITRKNNELWGLTRSLIFNAVRGVHTEWTKELEIRGVGYRAQLKGKNLDLQLGQSHPIIVDPPKGISFELSQRPVGGQNINFVTVKGISKQLVGDVAAKIRAYKPPEPYKGKGVRYHGEYVRRKAGKAAT